MAINLLALDQGTTSTRALLFNEKGACLAHAQHAFKQHYPQKGWVEHCPEEIWDTAIKSCLEVIKQCPGGANDIHAIGISNQRETTVVWNKNTGKPIYPAIVWQDQRTAAMCARLREEGVEPNLSKKTGLLLSPYFSATKIAWLLRHIKGAKESAQKGELCFGTIDTYLLWKLTGGKAHQTDVTNASRTLLFNIQTHQWDDELLDLFDIPKAMLPTVAPCVFEFGVTDRDHFKRAIPITGIAGDQQCASIGQGCFHKGMLKTTFGTGCFALLNTGAEPVQSKFQLLTTIAYQIQGQTAYALEGSIFNAGSAINWLKDGLGVIGAPAETEALATELSDNGGVSVLPAFSGLGAPFWDPNVKACILGLTLDTKASHIVRATLEGVVYRVRDLCEAFIQDTQQEIQSVRVDGGMVVNDWLMQFLSDTLNTTIDRSKNIESTAVGAAFLAGLGSGIFGQLSDIDIFRQTDKLFYPNVTTARYQKGYEMWCQAVEKVRKFD